MNAQLKEAPAQDGFPVWKTITLIKDTKATHWESTDRAMQIWLSLMDPPPGGARWDPSVLGTEVDLVLVRVQDFGFTENVRYDKLCETAIGQGLQLCPIEVGESLRDDYRDQRLGEIIHVGMKGHVTKTDHIGADDDADDDPGVISTESSDVSDLAEEGEPEEPCEIYVIQCGMNGKRFLHASDGSPDRKYQPRDKFVFVKPRAT